MAEENAAAPLPPAATPDATPDATPARRPLSRREVVLGLAAGGAALVATNVPTAVLTERVSTRAAEARAQAQLQATRSELQRQISLLERQLALYKDMERLGLDQLIRGLLQAYDSLWGAIRAGIAALQKGVSSIDSGLSRFENGLAGLRGAAQLLSDLLGGLEAQVRGVQDIVNEILKRTGPISEAVSGFLSWLASRVPFGVGARALEAIDRLSALVANVPTLVADTRQRLLTPLQGDWLSTAEGEGLQGRLFDQLRTAVLTPLQTHLDQLAAMTTRWDEDAKPIRTALDEREKLRGQIARLEESRQGRA